MYIFSVVRDEKHLVIRSPRNKISPESLNIVKVSKMKFPSFANMSARLQSFNSWPKSLSQKPTLLAKAGFYYTGTGDRVCCFCCGLGPWTDGLERRGRSVEGARGLGYIMQFHADGQGQAVHPDHFATDE